MRIWFVRCNGYTAHNQPGSRFFVEGEPPTFPETKFNYKDECLTKGFARIGLPATGDLRHPWWRECGRTVYGDEWLTDSKIKEHEQFSSIYVGDLVVLPTDRIRYEVHLGIVVPSRMGVSLVAPDRAYYYFYNIASGDWFENAHRIDVKWARTGDEFIAFDVPEIGGTWRRAFGQVLAASSRVIDLAEKAGLL